MNPRNKLAVILNWHPKLTEEGLKMAGGTGTLKGVLCTLTATAAHCLLKSRFLCFAQ